MALSMGIALPLGGLRARVKAAAPTTFAGVVRLVREDLWTHGGEWSRPGFHAMAAYRLGFWLPHAPGLARLVLRPLYCVLYVWARNVYGIELPATAVVGRRLRFSHQSGIVIHTHARIGDDCVIRQNVTIGAPNVQNLAAAPVLGDRVELGAGAAIIGRVTVGDGVRIGPNAVVMSNVPAGSTVFAPNSRTVRLAVRVKPPATAPGVSPVTPPRENAGPRLVEAPQTR